MTISELRSFRLSNQQLTGTGFTSPKELVSWMGALQAQDFAMAKWAIGLRLPGFTEAGINSAIDKGEILRTHLMRPTWHIVSSDDIYWLLELSAPVLKASMKTRHKELGLTENVFSQCNTIIVNALAGGNSCIREELMAELTKKNIKTDANRSSHILMNAELDGLICSGAQRVGKNTYALLQERVPFKKLLSREESMSKLAEMYFRSHGPATLKDFCWWSGLRVREARQAMESLKARLLSEIIGTETIYFFDSGPIAPAESGVFLLPAYDEYIISYTNRTAILPPEIQKKAISENGLFRPVILFNGQVVGLWKRTIKSNVVIIETEYFEKPDQEKISSIVSSQAESFGKFLDKKTGFI